jgi:hypothetical protein
LRQHHHPVFAAFAVAHDDHASVKVHILDPQAKPLHQPHACAIQQASQQAHLAIEVLKQIGHLLPGQNAGNALFLGRAVQAINPRQVDRQHLAVQKQQGAERLVVGGWRNLPFIGQHVQERLYFCRAHGARMPHDPRPAMPSDEKPHPVQVRFLGLKAIVQIPDALAELVEQTGGAKSRCAGFHAWFIFVKTYSIKHSTR